MDYEMDLELPNSSLSTIFESNARIHVWFTPFASIKAAAWKKIHLAWSIIIKAGHSKYSNVHNLRSEYFTQNKNTFRCTSDGWLDCIGKANSFAVPLAEILFTLPLLTIEEIV